jgi:hypothetical protein
LLLLQSLREQLHQEKLSSTAAAEASAAATQADLAVKLSAAAEGLVPEGELLQLGAQLALVEGQLEVTARERDLMAEQVGWGGVGRGTQRGNSG